MSEFQTTQSGILLPRRTVLASAAALGAVGLGLGLTGCGKKEGDAAATAGAASAAGAPVKGGTLRLGMTGGSPSDSLDPRTYADSIPIAMSLMLWNGLVEIDATGNATGEVLESWEASDGAKKWIFKVRQGLVFTSGKALDAEDVIYSINLHRGETKSPAKSLLADISDIKANSPSEIEITLSSGNSDLPYNFADYHLMVVPKGFTDWAKPDGTGAFTLVDFQPGNIATFKRKEGEYWKPGRGHFDAVELRYIVDDAQRMQALTTGQVDAVNRVDPKTASLLQQDPKVSLSRTEGMGNRFAFVAHVNKDPFKNRDLMMALKYGIDREQIVQNVYNGFASVGNDTLVGPKMKFADTSVKIAYDPEKAKFHLDKAGVKEVELKVSEGAYTTAPDCAAIFAESFAKTGGKVNVKRVSGDGYWDNVWLKDPFCAVYWGNRPTIDLQFQPYTAGDPWNDTKYNNPEFDKLKAAAKVEIDEAKRAELYSVMQKMVATEAGTVHFATADYIDASSTKVQGLAPHGRYDMSDQRLAEKGWFTA